MSEYQAPWRKQMLPGSFRGVPFGVRVAQTQVGRRVVVHEYPQRPDVYTEDLGPKADAFTIEAVVIGPDYMKGRDELIDALKQVGPGILVHPYYGERLVTLVAPARITETFSEGGKVTFSLDFINAGDNDEPYSRIDTQDAVEAAADEAELACTDDFANNFSLDGVADFVETSALDLAGGVMSALDDARRSIVPDLSILSDFVAEANSIMGSVNRLIRAPAAFAQSVLGMFGALKSLAISPLYALNSYRGLFDYGGKHASVPRTTPSRLRQSSNQVAITGLVRRVALIQAARVASRVEIDTYDQAVALRDDLAARLDDEAAGIIPAPVGNEVADTTIDTVSEPVYQALTALRVALIRDLTSRAAKAPRIARVQLPSTMPALVAAYRIFGDATRADEIISRNKKHIRHPGFVPGGVTLEVISQ